MPANNVVSISYNNAFFSQNLRKQVNYAITNQGVHHLEKLGHPFLSYDSRGIILTNLNLMACNMYQNMPAICKLADP